MSNKIKTKKQVQKVAEAVRLIHPYAKWMWLTAEGKLCLSNEPPDLQGISKPSQIFASGFDVYLSLQDTVVQLHGN